MKDDILKILDRQKKESDKLLKKYMEKTNETISELIHYIKEQKNLISQIRQELVFLEKQLYIDFLTKVKNQNYYKTFFMTDKFRRASDKHFLFSLKDYIIQKNDNLAVAYLDFANFKKANDYGHMKADEVLMAWSAFFISEKMFNVIRIGGDEFLLLGTEKEIKDLQKKILSDEIVNLCNKSLFNKTINDFFIKTIPIAGIAVIEKEKILEAINESLQTEISLKNIFEPLIEKAELKSILNKVYFKYYSLGFYNREKDKIIKSDFNYSLQKTFQKLQDPEIQKIINNLIKEKYKQNLSNKDILAKFESYLREKYCISSAPHLKKTQSKKIKQKK